MKELWELFIVFLRIGSVTFGGGYAMLPILTRDLVENRHWATEDELMDYFAVGQCTPGIIAINVSTFIGYKKKGIPGAIVATLGFVTIPIVLILIIAAALSNFASYPVVQHALAGVRVCVFVLVVQAVVRLWKKSIVSVKTFLLYLAVFLLMAFSRKLPVSIPAAVLVLASGLFGVVACREEAEQK